MHQHAPRRAVVRALSSVVAATLALPLAACASGTANGVGLTRAGCPADIRIHTDDLPRVEWGFLYGLLDAERVRVGSESISAPLMIDGRESGSTLSILLGDPDDGEHANVALHADESILLGAVDTDVALRDVERYPTVGVFAPLLRDPRIAYWDKRVYPGVTTVRAIGDRLLPDGSGLVPFVTTPGDPFTDYAIGDGVLLPEQIITEPPPSVEGLIDARGIPAQTGDALDDPARFEKLTEAPSAFGSQRLDEAGYRRDADVLSIRPQALVRYADCLRELVPVLQQALADYLDHPQQTSALIVELSAQLGDDGYDTEIAAAAFDLLDDEFAGNGLDGTIGDIDFGRVRDLVESAIPAWRRADVAVPADATADDIVTNDFIDATIGR